MTLAAAARRPFPFFRRGATILVVVAVAGGLPGAPVPRVVRDLVAPPLPAEVKDRDGVVEVSVVDSVSGAALPGAQVRALSIVGGRAYLADAEDTTGAGLARLTRLPHGEAWVLADAPGHARGSSHLLVEAGTRAVSLALGPEHALDVVARDEAGAPVPGVEIEVTEPSEPIPVGARGGADGTAHAGRLGDPPWRVSGRAPGYEEATARVLHDGDVAQLVMRRLGALLVTVLGPDDAPVEGAHVQAAGATLWPARQADTGPAGDVRLGALAAGSYAVRATRGDDVSPIELGVQLARGEEKALVLHLAHGRFVSVLVVDGDGDDASSVPAARITLAEGGLSPFPIEARTDGKGRARLGPIAPGSATLSAQADGFVGRGGIPVAEPPPPVTRVVLSRAGTLTGRVVDARGFPVDGATIEIVGTDPGGAPIFDDPRRATFRSAHFDAMLGGAAPMVPMGELGVVPGPVPPVPHEGMPMPAAGPGGTASMSEPWVTRDDGTFRATPASPGRVRAIVHHPQYVEAQSDVVTLAPGGEAHVEVVMSEGGSLEGRVLDARDMPVPGARVTVSATRGTVERTTRAASDGTFAIAALPDEVVLTASVDGDDAQPDERMTVTIPPGGRQEVVVHLPPARDPLPVVVVDGRGAPLDAAQVSASSTSPEIMLRTTTFTAKDGTAALKRARGVPLRVEVTAPGRAPRVVSTDGTETELKVELAPAEAAHGEVVTSRGRDAVSGAEVALYTDLGVRRARSGADGTFTLSGLGAGTANLRVRAAGFAPVARSVTIPDTGGRRAFEVPRVELSEEGSVEGEVVDGRGEPVAGARVARDHVPTWLTVGSTPQGVALTDARGRFTLRELPEGSLVLEAYSPDVGRARATVQVVSGRATVRVRLALAPGNDEASRESAASGNVAVTLGETDAPVEVVVVSVAEGSEAERAGVAPGDVVTAVDGSAVHTMAEARARLAGPASDDVVMTLRRAGAPLTLRVTREAVHR